VIYRVLIVLRKISSVNLSPAKAGYSNLWLGKGFSRMRKIALLFVLSLLVLAVAMPAMAAPDATPNEGGAYQWYHKTVPGKDCMQRQYRYHPQGWELGKCPELLDLCHVGETPEDTYVVPANSKWYWWHLKHHSETDFLIDDAHPCPPIEEPPEVPVPVYVAPDLVETQSLMIPHLAGLPYEVYWVNEYTGDLELIDECSGIVSDFGDLSCVITPQAIMLNTYVGGVLVEYNEVDENDVVCYGEHISGAVERPSGSAQPCD
jgi:hypothetical protein